MVQLLLNKTASFWALPVSEVGRSWLRICWGAAFAVGGGGGGGGQGVQSIARKYIVDLGRLASSEVADRDLYCHHIHYVYSR